MDDFFIRVLVLPCEPTLRHDDPEHLSHESFWFYYLSPVSLFASSCGFLVLVFIAAIRYFDGSSKDQECAWETRLCEITRSEWDDAVGEYHVVARDGWVLPTISGTYAFMCCLLIPETSILCSRMLVTFLFSSRAKKNTMN